MNKKLKQLSVQFPDLLSTYKTNWSSEPFDFLLQEEKTVIDIDTLDSLSKNKEQILKKVKAANAHGYTVIRILDNPILERGQLVTHSQFRRIDQLPLRQHGCRVHNSRPCLLGQR